MNSNKALKFQKFEIFIEKRFFAQNKGSFNI